MAVPERLRIPYEDDDYRRFNAVGRVPDGTQFMAFVTGAFPSGMKYYSRADWRSKKRWLAVIHRFAPDGTHIGSDIRLGGFESEGEDCHESEHVILEPRDIMFHPPWDSGEYST